MSKTSRSKGARGEREWAGVLTKNGHPAHRGRQYSGGPNSPDVVCDSMPIHWEVKRVERLNIWSAMDQAKKDCGDKLPGIAFRRNHWPWMVCLDADDFFDLLRMQ